MKTKTKQSKYNPRKSFWATKESPIGKLEKEKLKKDKMKNKVKKEVFEYEEEVRDFTGLIFHCPQCNEIFHLHIATVELTNGKNKNEKN